VWSCDPPRIGGRQQRPLLPVLRFFVGSDRPSVIENRNQGVFQRPPTRRRSPASTPPAPTPQALSVSVARGNQADLPGAVAPLKSVPVPGKAVCSASSLPCTLQALIRVENNSPHSAPGQSARVASDSRPNGVCQSSGGPSPVPLPASGTANVGFDITADQAACVWLSDQRSERAVIPDCRTVPPPLAVASPGVTSTELRAWAPRGRKSKC
jgi:hypothetical protein